MAKIKKLKKLRGTPKDLRKMFREYTDWNVLLNALQELAIGGKEITNGNGVKSITVPNVRAIEILISTGWGKDDTSIEEIRELASDISNKSSMPERKDSEKIFPINKVN